MSVPAAVPYRPRVIDAEIDLLMSDLAAVSLDGPKGVGKTETALQRVERTFRFDRREDLELLAAQPDLLRSIPSPVLLDEWQRWPEIWDLVRRAVDDGARPGTYLLTGSASPLANIHTGAGADRAAPDATDDTSRARRGRALGVAGRLAAR
ncbi:AAA family ATPase [uncultured Friedmanniella sp.]|uniref:AAA family ATPase n=1 Tax=uncultured Friedmanniella sp. TaxID=335381 RepID=UPI0035CC7427